MLFDLFHEKGIGSETSWEKVYDLLHTNERFLMVPNVKDRKRIFRKYIDLGKENFKKSVSNRKQTQRNDFKKMLEEYKHINTETKITSLLPIFYEDPRWNCMDDKEREDAFLEYMEEVFMREADAEKQLIANQCEKLKKQMLEIKQVTSSTRWEEMKDIMYYNNTWNELHEYFRLKQANQDFQGADHQLARLGGERASGR